MSLKHELQNILSGNGTVRHGEIIQAIVAYLRREKEAGSGIEKGEFDKNQEEGQLRQFISDADFWYSEIDPSQFIIEGAEQKIFAAPDPAYVIKLNDAIFYSFWVDYFHSLLIHNYFFPHLAYELIGFQIKGGKLYSVVKQPFVRSTEETNLDHVKDFMGANGFIHKKRNDYFHPGLGLILEDLHDENVLTSEGVLQFIDTVFYLTPEFYQK